MIFGMSPLQRIADQRYAFGHAAHPHRFWKLADRFSTNAAAPSSMSSEENTRSLASSSSAWPSASDPSSVVLSTAFASRTATGPRLASVSASSRAADSAWPVSHDAIDQSEAECGLGVDDLTEQDQLLGAGQSDESREPLGPARARHDSEPDFGQSEERRARRRPADRNTAPTRAHHRVRHLRWLQSLAAAVRPAGCRRRSR